MIRKRFATLVAPVVLALTIVGCSSPSTTSTTPTAVAAATVEVPDVVGMLGNEARDLLTDAGLTVDWDGELVIKASNWTVDAQSPAAGETVDPGATIALTVSKPDEAPSEDTPATVSSEDFDAALRQALGVEEYTQLLASDASLWGGYISGVRVERSNAYVTLQIASNDPSRDETGERAASAIATLLPATAFEGIGWVIVEDASGVVISQTQPAPIM